MDKGIHEMMQKPFSKYGVHSKNVSLIIILGNLLEESIIPHHDDILRVS
jgi:hypothetical protein